jgi:hypothetical protein
MRTKEIAFHLRIAFKTAACHRQRVLDKMGASNTADLVRRAIEQGLINGTHCPPSDPPVPRYGNGFLEACIVGRHELHQALERQRALLSQQRALLREFHDVRDRQLVMQKRSSEFLARIAAKESL